jgi:hypothetical protein
MSRKIANAFFILLLVSGCSKDKTLPHYSSPACIFLPVYYVPQTSNDPQSAELIIKTNCGSAAGLTCHAPGNGNYDFTTYEVVAERIRSGSFTERIFLPQNNPLKMPPRGASMDSCELAKLMSWINNGFPKN